MRFAVKKLRAAEADALAAATWYDEQLPGLGSAFLDELEAAVARLNENPELFAIRFSDVRCVRLRRFKDYGVFYLIVGHEVRVIAVHHGARHPRSLRARRSELG